MSIADFEAEFMRCTFIGGPPKGFESWSAWAASKPKTGVTIHASQQTDSADSKTTCGLCGGSGRIPKPDTDDDIENVED